MNYNDYNDDDYNDDEQYFEDYFSDVTMFAEVHTENQTEEKILTII